MNHIAQVLNTKFKSPTQSTTLPSESTESSKTFRCGSWKSRMLVKMRECGDAIKNMMTFDKSSNTVETTPRTMSTVTNSTSFFSQPKTSVSPLSDVVAFSSVASKDQDYEDEEDLNSNEKSTKVNDSPNRFRTSYNTTSSSLKSFLMLEKQVMEEYLDEKETMTIKKKISAEPFLSYAEGAATFVWEDDAENNLSCRAWNSTEHLNFSDIHFEHPYMNSTFCECSLANKHRTSSPIRNCDSGFENHFSI